MVIRSKNALVGASKFPLVSIVVVNYNGKHVLPKCLDNVCRIEYPRLEVLCVDNASRDDSAKDSDARFPNIQMIALPENRGYAAAANVGISQSRGDFIVLINNDVEVDASLVHELVVATMAADHVGMAAPKILLSSDHTRIDSAGMLIYPDGLNRGRGHLQRDRGQFEAVEEVSHASGCAALYRRSMLEEIGLFDESFFMFGEDTDLGIRGRLAGWKCLYVPSALAFHAYSATVGKHSELKAFYVERNRTWVALKSLPPLLLAVSPVFTFLRWAWQAWGAITGVGMAGAFRRSQGPLKLIVILVRANLASFLKLSEMTRKRTSIQRKRKLSTLEVCQWFRRFGISARELALSE